MSNESKSIHDFDFTLICEYFKSVERQGPGSPEVTRKALSFIGELPIDARIADLGCGTGGQTMVLAEQLQGQITGLDLSPGFIDVFNRNAAGKGFQDRVKGIVGSMDELPFREGELDLIWSEGAISHIGFERGLTEWHTYLKAGGFVAVTEATWFTSERPAEVEDFWMANYPEIDTIPAKVSQMEQAGYLPVAHFILPETCWIDHYYAPLVPVQEAYLEKYAGDEAMTGFIRMQQYDRALYNKYKQFYGYVFYIGRKR